MKILGHWATRTTKSGLTQILTKLKKENIYG